MSKYYPLNKSFKLKQNLYRIYINFVGIFLRLPAPTGIDFKYKTFNFWRKGDEIMMYIKKGKLRYISLLASGTGEFGDATFKSLKELDDFWNEFDNACQEVNDKIEKENLCTDPMCDCKCGRNH